MFNGLDSYDTPEDHPVSLLFKLMFKSRWYFYFRNFGTFIRSGRCAAKGLLDKDMQIHYSNENIRLIEDCGAKLRLRGLDNLRALNGQPAVIIGNHMSLLETAVLHAIIRAHLDFSFVIKESLLKIPYFGNILRALDAVAVGRNDPREDFKHIMTEGSRILKEGRSIIIFPQATRSVEFKPAEFNSIGVKLARNAGVQVLPMALKTDFVRTGKILRDLGPVDHRKEVYFEFGDPLTITGNGKEQHKQIIEFIKSRVDSWRD